MGSLSYIAELVLALLNRVEASMWGRTEKAWQQANPFVPTLPPGYTTTSGAAPAPADLSAYFLAMQPRDDGGD